MNSILGLLHICHLTRFHKVVPAAVCTSQARAPESRLPSTMEADDSDPPANPPGAGSASASASATPTPSASGPGPIRLRRKPIPRKGHTKSRRGCLQCKRRRVKCPETLPECCNCTRIGLVCEYPSTRTSPASWLAAISSPSAPLQSTPTMFTADDMRFFHHFLLHAYPPLPILGDDIWRGVATLSHSVGFADGCQTALVQC